MRPNMTMEISKTDLQKVICYLNGASELHKAQGTMKHRWRAQLIKKLVRKLEKKLPDGNTKPAKTTRQ